MLSNKCRHCARRPARAPSSNNQARWFWPCRAAAGSRGRCPRAEQRCPGTCAPARPPAGRKREKAQQHAHVEPREASAKSGNSGLSRAISTPAPATDWSRASRWRRERRHSVGSNGSAVDHQHAKVLQRAMSRLRQRELVGDAGFQRIGACHDVQQQGRSTALRAIGPITAISRSPGWRKWRRRVAARRQRSIGRLVRVDTAMKCGHAQRAPMSDPSESGPSPPRAPPTIRPRSHPACGRDRMDCWSCRRSRCSSANRQARRARWSCRG